MANIVTLIEESRLFRIGNNLRELGKLATQVEAEAAPADKESLEAYKLSHKDSGGSGSDEMKEVCAGLSMAEITEAGGTWTQGPQVGPNNCDGIAAIADVKFVFEKADEKIVVIPHENALDFAFQAPPLKEGGYVNNFAWKSVAVLEASLRTKFTTHPTLSGQAADIMKVIEATIRQDYPAPDGDKDKATFYEQLGGYTCRQCG